MLNPRLAGRYAKSLMDLAIEKNALEAVYSDMLFMRGLLQSSAEFATVLKSPVIASDKKKKILDALTKDRFNNITTAFNNLLVNKGREFYLTEIVDAFIQQYKDYKGIHIIKLTTAVPVSDAVKQSITAKVKSDSGLKDIELLTYVEKDIIGGFILEIGDKLVDASISYDLANIKKQFANNDFIYKIR